MKKMALPAKKKGKATPEPQRMAQAARQAQVQKVQLMLGTLIVVISVIGGFVLANPAVGIGLAVLAGFRLLILRAEMRKEAQQMPETAPAPSAEGRRNRVSAKRA